MLSIIKAIRLNRKASDPRYKPDKVIEAMDLYPGSSIADIGAGGGYYCLRFAQVVGKEGKVYTLEKENIINELDVKVKDFYVTSITRAPRALFVDGKLDGIPGSRTSQSYENVDHIDRIPAFDPEDGHFKGTLDAYIYSQREGIFFKPVETLLQFVPDIPALDIIFPAHDLPLYF